MDQDNKNKRTGNLQPLTFFTFFLYISWPSVRKCGCQEIIKERKKKVLRLRLTPLYAQILSFLISLCTGQ